MTVPPVFSSPGALDDAFASGLERQLDDGGLGAFILALANAGFEQDLWERLGGRIAQRYRRHAEHLQCRIRDGESAGASQDDEFVFLKLLALGLDYLDVAAFRRVEGWELQHNLIRGLRPSRFAGATATGIREPFDPHCFNFTRPVLEKERLWCGPVLGHTVSFFFNKFPFARRHLLVVPDAAACRPQYLTRDMLRFAWRLLDELGRFLPGIGMGYNSYGALASVNHLHFQCFDRVEPLPVERPRWRHNGGGEPYPAMCRTADTEAAAWRLIREFHAEPVAYNLVMRPGRIYALPRRLQGTYAASDWSTGHAWYEMAGGIVVTRRRVYDSLTGRDIAGELARVAGSPGAGLQGTA